jgi:glutamate-1-semialdehyde 2,1-aminomutase
MLNRKSKFLFQRANKIIPGGVNSPVRAFKSVGSEPILLKKVPGLKFMTLMETNI